MSQTWHLNGCDLGESQPDDYSAASPSGVPDYVSPFVGLAMLAQDNDGVVARGPRIILSCGPYDNEYDDEQPG